MRMMTRQDEELLARWRDLQDAQEARRYADDARYSHKLLGRLDALVYRAAADFGSAVDEATENPEWPQ